MLSSAGGTQRNPTRRLRFACSAVRAHTMPCGDRSAAAPFFHMTVTKRNVLANFVGQGVSLLLTLSLLPLYLPLLGTEAYGLVGFYTALTALFGLFDAGLGAAASRETARRAVVPAQAGSLGGLLRTLEWVYWTMAGVAAAVCWLAGPWLATHWLHLEHLSVETAVVCLRLLGLSLACRLPMGLYSGVLIGLHRQVGLNVLRIVQALLSAPGSYLLLKYVSRAPETYFRWQLALAVVNVGAIAVLAWRGEGKSVAVLQPMSGGSPRFALRELRSIARFAAGSASIAVLVLILTQTNRFMLSAMVPLALCTGIFMLAQALGWPAHDAALPMRLLAGSTTALFTAVSLVATGPELRTSVAALFARRRRRTSSRANEVSVCEQNMASERSQKATVQTVLE